MQGWRVTFIKKTGHPQRGLASNLSELEVTLGRLPDAVSDARASIIHADQSGDAFERMKERTRRRMRCISQVITAKPVPSSSRPNGCGREKFKQQISSPAGFRYCDWLLAPAERAVWQRLLDRQPSRPKSRITVSLADAERRASRYFAEKWNWYSLLAIALDQLTLARVWLIRVILEADSKSGIGIASIGRGRNGPEIPPLGSAVETGKILKGWQPIQQSQRST